MSKILKPAVALTDARLDKIPTAMKDIPHWVVWILLPHKEDPENGKPRKLPINPATGKAASTAESDTWGTFDEVVALCKKGNYAGVGFVLTDDNDIICIDSDSSLERDPQGKTKIIDLDTRRIQKAAKSEGVYFEISQSGKGLHYFCTGKAETIKTEGIEVYSHSRFIAMTGCGKGDLVDGQKVLNIAVDAAKSRQGFKQKNAGANITNNGKPFPGFPVNTDGGLGGGMFRLSEFNAAISEWDHANLNGIKSVELIHDGETRTKSIDLYVEGSWWEFVKTCAANYQMAPDADRPHVRNECVRLSKVYGRDKWDEAEFDARWGRAIKEIEAGTNKITHAALYRVANVLNPSLYIAKQKGQGTPLPRDIAVLEKALAVLPTDRELEMLQSDGSVKKVRTLNTRDGFKQGVLYPLSDAAYHDQAHKALYKRLCSDMAGKCGQGALLNEWESRVADTPEKEAAFPLITRDSIFKAARAEGFTDPLADPTSPLYEWPQIEPLEPEQKAASWSDDLLPAPFSGWVKDIANRQQSHPEFVAVAALVALATVVGRQLRIRPKALDDWEVTPNMWGAGIGMPSTMKSPALNEAMKPLMRQEKLAKDRFKAESAQFSIVKEAHDQQRAATKKRAAKILLQIKQQGDPVKRSALQANLDVLIAQVAVEPDAPVRKRLLTSDPTTEKLGELLNENPNGLAVVRDELAGWLASLEKQGREGDRAFFLESWNGDKPYPVDRIGRGTVDIPALCLSLIGGIQPSLLRKYLSHLNNNDGLVQRFQLLVYPESRSSWKYVDQHPDRVLARAVHDIFTQMVNIPCASIGAEANRYSGLWFVRFTEEAQPVFVEWYTNLMQSVRHGDMPEHLQAHLIKYSSLIPSLALVFWLIEGADEQVEDGLEEETPSVVSLAALERAIKWHPFLLSHAEKAYSVITDAGQKAATALVRKITAGALPDRFTERDIVRRHWSGLGKDAVGGALQILVDTGWLVPQMINQGVRGRPATVYYINPGAR